MQAIPQLFKKTTSQDVFANGLRDPSKGNTPLIQERIKLLVVGALQHVNMFRAMVCELFASFVILIDDQEQFSASAGAVHSLFPSSMPTKLLLDPPGEQQCRLQQCKAFASFSQDSYTCCREKPLLP